MIKIKVSYDDTYVKQITVKGHANYDDYGKDIVCASVSSIVITSCNLALKLDEASVLVEQKEGFIEVLVLKQDDIINKVFLNMIEMLEELSKDYKKNVKIII